MSKFTEAELEYLQSQRLGRLATVNQHGEPQVAAVGFDEAATISGGATTAWEALLDRGGLQDGQRVLILGAAGGVGSFAVQLARWKGAQVIGTAGAANVDFVRSLGAETVVDYTTTSIEQVVHDVDLVLDAVGGQTLDILQR